MEVSKKLIQLSKENFDDWNQSLCDYDMSLLYSRIGYHSKAKLHMKRAFKTRWEIYGDENHPTVKQFKDGYESLNVIRDK